MSKGKILFPEILERSSPLRLGFIPTSDCAPLVVARESGLFDKYELRVDLCRENRWASIRDRILYGELDAAQAPAALPFVTNLGLESDSCACVSALVISLQGNAITLSRDLWDQGVRDAQMLRDHIYQNRSRRTCTLGIAFPSSPPFFLLRQWLKAGGIVPGVEANFVVLPPAQMFPTLKLGYLDGFCTGEPWTSLAIEAGVGACAATSADLAPLHPEKVLMVRRDFAEQQAGRHERLIAALLEACAFCDKPENLPLIAEMLGRAEYVNAPTQCLMGRTPRGDLPGGAMESAASTLNIFHQHNANEPSDDKAEWVVNRLDELIDQEVLRTASFRRTPVIKNVFRRDIFERAKTLAASEARAVYAEVENLESASQRIA